MCGIVGYIGTKEAYPILIKGLHRLEYRGYDSAGIALISDNQELNVYKTKGKVADLERFAESKDISGCIGIAHTRWATHGEPNDVNAHPHYSQSKNLALIHNGIIENYTELKEKLLKHGYTFYSQTDTEVVIKLVDYYYKKYNLGPIDAIAKTMVRVRGSYALELMFRDYPGEIWVARKDSPMIIGIADGETYVASDVPAILKYTRDVYYIRKG